MVKTENGGTVPLTLKFLKEDEQWKIFAINKPRVGLLDQYSTIPNESELIDLTNESMLKFAQAVKAKNFTDFHVYVSTLWQMQFTAQKFEEIFKVFLDKNIDMVAAVQNN